MASSALVTGASGFIGSALLRHLVREGFEVAYLVRPGSRPPSDPVVARSARRIEITHFEAAEVATALNGSPMGTVFHLAAYGVRPEDRDPLEMCKANIMATVALLSAVRDWPLRSFVCMGSCSEYSPAAPPTRIREDHPLTMTGLYGAAKAAGGLYGAAMARQLGIPFVALRLFGVYGPGEPAYRLTPYLIDRLMNNQRADLTPGEQVRDYLHVDDVVTALMMLASQGGQGGPFNLCSGEPVTVRTMADTVRRTLGKPPTLLAFGARPYRPDEPMWIVGDNAAFCGATGWRPRITLDEGIERMIALHSAS